MKGAGLATDGMTIWQHEVSLAWFGVCWHADDAPHGLWHADMEDEGYRDK
jgi:hypothetical protein